MATAFRRINHEDRLGLVEHLHELRTRLIISIAAIAIAFAFCLWQNNALLHIINKPLETQTKKQVRAGDGTFGANYVLQTDARVVATQLQVVVQTLERPGSGASSATRTSLHGVTPRLRRAITGLSRPPQGDKPVTLGIGEPFTATLSVALIFALILALPIVLYELYGFLLPALSPNQQRIATPLTLAIPFLFVLGVLFGYFIVLPAAVRFFQNFNSSQFTVLVQANQYYHFAAVTLLAMGLIFQIPVAILAATRAEIVTPRQLRHNRRYAIIACAAIAAFLPGDLITLMLETVPLYLLFEASVLLATVVDRRDRRRQQQFQTP